MGSQQNRLNNKITSEEKALFQKAMQEHHFLPAPLHPHKKPSIPPIQIQLEDCSYSEQNHFKPHDFLVYKRQGCQAKTLKKLQSGKFPIQSSLDLHGMTVEKARVAMIELIEFAYQHQFKTLKIIHGKGSVLKNHVYHWLIQINIVLALSSAQGKDGGTGALYVLLKSS